MRGRTIRVPKSEVRPTQDRVREALFSSLQLDVPDARFLDLFAGSGAVGLEAVSRGASAVCWVEESGAVFKILKSNTAKLCGDYDQQLLRCVRGDVFDFVQRCPSGTPFDIIFADPPYQKRGRNNRIPSPSQLLVDILKSDLLSGDGILVLEQGADEPLPDVSGWELVRDKRYGGARLRFFRKCDTSEK